VLLAAVANCFGLQIMTCTAQIFQAMGQMRMTAILNLLTGLLRTLTAAAMWLTLHRATAKQWAVASTLVSLLGAIVAVGTVSVRLPRPSFSVAMLKKRFREGVEFAFASSTTSAYNDLDKAMLSHYGMNAANGIYTFAYRVVDIATMPIVSLRDAAMPTMFRKGDKSLEEASTFARRLWSRSFPAACLAALAMFVLAPLLPAIAGPGFVEDLHALRWLCLIPVFRSLHEISGSALTGAGLQRYRTGTQAVAVALNLGMNLLLIPTLGWRGAALSSLATDGLLGLMNWNLLTLLVSRRKRVCVS
jgi:O-antigen/teichoic acid export membrane protein